MTQASREEFEQDSPGLSLRELYFIVFRHRLLILGMAGGIAAAATLAALFFISRTYESSANLLVRTGRESMAVDPASGGFQQIRMRSREEEIRTEMEIIKSREVIDAVVTSLGMDFFRQRPAGPLAQLSRLWSSRSCATGCLTSSRT
jgi:uncharacterized protein involved in exopolysaccharide biosynthesis